jgi:SAM-dependent methyltransferase
MPHPMEATLVYRVWQAPFAEQKLQPFLRANDVSRIRRVLDVGCGPGTNAKHFTGCDYLGVDINPAYIADATRRFGKRFRTVDVTQVDAEALGGAYDCILVNSLLHHLDDASTQRLLSHLETLLTPDGRVHILELVLPPRLSVSRLLAKLDRGDYPRPLERWRTLFSAAFSPIAFEPYPLGVPGVTFWSMVYFIGGRRAQ